MTSSDATDRRSQRSQDLLLDALVALMQERGYERLTIQNLLDRAGVGRATFYAHFDSKEQLLANSIARLHQAMAGVQLAAPTQCLAFIAPFFAHLDSHRAIYNMTVARASEHTVERHVRAMLHTLVRQGLAMHAASVEAAVGVEPATHYIVGALWTTAVWWLGSGSALPHEDISAGFLRLTFAGLESAGLRLLA
jgi:AcrR family transcriptional regulator